VWCLWRGDDRGGVQWRIWRGPHALCYRGGDYEAACVWSGSDGTLSDGGWCCSGTMALGPHMTVAFSVRCSLLLRVPYRRGATLSSDDFMCVRLSQVVVVWRGVEFEFAARLFSIQPGAVESSFE